MSYDVVVIGTGPGGYVAAIKAAQLGLSVAVVEKRKTFGGTCLNVGCIPSKALLHASEVFAEAGHSFDTLGVEISKPKLNLEKMMAHKDATVKSNTSGVEFLFKKNKITPYIGTGKIVAKGKVSVTAEDGSVQEIEAKNIIIATGSDVAGIPGVKVDIDEKVILSSTGAIALGKVPGHLVVVGGGVIGLELGSVWARLGAKVTVVEYLDKVLGAMDGEVSKQFQRLLEKQGIVFKLGAKVTGVEKAGKGAKVTFEPVKGGDAETIDADAVLISTGRRPYTDGLGLAEAGVNLDDRGRVAIDGHWRTNVEGIYAIGDVVQGPMLAHKAEDEGIAVAEIIAGQAGHVNFDVIPSVVYTQPEVASVGKTEEELKAAGIEYKIGKFPFTANGRARAMLHTDGFVKILADKATDRVLGAHILGYNAGEMIHELAVLMEFGGSSEDLARTCHAHPTMSEAVRESALATFAKPIHM
ncbi:dihydrolipoyl dehydrogenase [Brucella pituitosa]|uniref:dihydrolipoyl dehydrogenase n=1 Tax=Brucella pituitosa TaxID=571256 RepID=UPI000C28000F|nr:dihydrolipoyl dehydrogenase [Brucella pituitosa]MCK4205807.1 dihydrolipoyl dehydrogenase [Brucella pituitosa]PJO46019.1 dihydrolipoyl dehydrogenase [Brucella pituitosa]PRA57951.1 dihydrolipoyl dehydrogenase [Ochrobactrum sp. MYb68]PRA88633.1 dihydrolipoyl dehydrogenase [Ochrobactrum sp. MYb29]